MRIQSQDEENLMNVRLKHIKTDVIFQWERVRSPQGEKGEKVCNPSTKYHWREEEGILSSLY